MERNGIEIGYLYFDINRTLVGTETSMMLDYQEKTIPQHCGLMMSSSMYMDVVPGSNHSLNYVDYFKFVDFDLSFNFVTSDHRGQVTSKFKDKGIADSSMFFELYAFSLSTGTPIKAILELKVLKRASGEIFSPRYQFELGALQKDILGFGVNERLHRKELIILNTTVPAYVAQAQAAPQASSYQSRGGTASTFQGSGSFANASGAASQNFIARWNQLLPPADIRKPFNRIKVFMQLNAGDKAKALLGSFLTGLSQILGWFWGLFFGKKARQRRWDRAVHKAATQPVYIHHPEYKKKKRRWILIIILLIVGFMIVSIYLPSIYF